MPRPPRAWIAATLTGTDVSVSEISIAAQTAYPGDECAHPFYAVNLS